MVWDEHQLVEKVGNVGDAATEGYNRRKPGVCSLLCRGGMLYNLGDCTFKTLRCYSDHRAGGGGSSVSI